MTQTDAKLAAVECWTADPCEWIPGEPGTAEYAERLVATRAAYAPWMAEVLGYARARGLDVLDVGSGQGIDLIGFARGGARVTGIDLTPRHVELARAHLTALGLDGAVVNGDAEQMPFDDDSFDLVSSNGVLHHTPDIAAALREVLRVLRPGGTARILLYNKRSWHYWLQQVLWRGLLEGRLRREGSMAAVLSDGVERSRIGARPLVRVYTAGEAKRLLAGAGFASTEASVRHFRWVDVPYGHVAERVGALRSQRVLDALGRVGGWYVVAEGVKS
jgi:ubiquinone/menaquinone biosynthesis C-methylase UbiE